MRHGSSTPPPHSDVVRRAALPEVLFVPDLALVLQVSEDEAEEAVLRGDCGPYVRLESGLAVLRESFLEALQAREIDPHQPHDSRRSSP